MSFYYTYGVLYVSDNFKKFEEIKGHRYKDYRRKWTEVIKNFDPGDFPLNLNVEVTTRCNLSCTFCTQPSLDNEQIGDMSNDLYTRLIEEGKKNNLPTVNLNGLGEPTLRKDIPEMIDLAKKAGVVDIMFHTNATTMTDRLAERLIHSGLDRIIFSVDSPEKETYETMRLMKDPKDNSKSLNRGFKWERVIENVKKFKKVRDNKGNKVPIIRTTMVVTDKTVNEVEKFLELWKPISDHITVQDLTWREKLVNGGDWENQENSAVTLDFNKIREKAIENDIQFICPYLYQSIYAFFDGKAIPCSNPNARKYMIMGDLNKNSIKEIWNNEQYKKLRKQHEDGKWNHHPICSDCEVPIVELYKELVNQEIQIDADFNKDKQRALVGEDMQKKYAG